MMDLTCTYTKIRKNFGRQPMFSEVGVHMLDSINPNTILQKQYILRNPVHTASQASLLQSGHEINTKRVMYQTTGANHAEGGWPKDVNFNDEEATTRHRRRNERDDFYINAVLDLYPHILEKINQNNAIEMYEMYFKGMATTEPVESYDAKVNNVYRDPNNRPIACINWSHEDNSKMVVAYCDKKYPTTGTVNKNYTCYVWDIENAISPIIEFQPPSACWQLACSPTSPSIVIGGLEDGKVCIFDIRRSKDPVSISEDYLAHRDPVTALLYVQSRLNTEFFSGSTDGKCMWYDIRDIKQPTESMMMAIRTPPGEAMTLATSEGVSALQFDRSFPTRFLCGTDTGFVINVNRKGKTLHEIMSSVFPAHNGPVRAVHRSPCTTKVFITCGDWKVNIWSDEVTCSPIITGTSQRYQIFDVAWAPNKVTGYMSVSADGKFRFWDLSRRIRGPLVTTPLSKYPLLKVKPHDDGRLVAIGDKKGDIYLLSLSNSLVISGDRDKTLMTQTFERETRRERILENRVKEIKLKLKTDEGVTKPINEDEIDENALLQTTQDEYFHVVAEQMKHFGMSRSTPAKKATLRTR